MMALYLEDIADHEAVAEATLHTQITDKDQANIQVPVPIQQVAITMSVFTACVSRVPRGRTSKLIQASVRASTGMRSESTDESGKSKGRKERECGQMGVMSSAWMPGCTMLPPADML